ncbi:ATP-binding protein [Dictyobacter kobayashii]|uniref:histidine kinase n=1 Tax=Dictyobacter kobayashii TaxID=2014872 RepID=A0A402AQW9_9CHLR|nr:ATP-binding protein [Dictyobacter kobayashii]GCE21490.1 hypothetical protein KDK_52900 [Dictyobacter kobayashii]
MDEITVEMGRRHDDADNTLVGGGKMGQLMREYNWASSPLGAVVTWPQSLRTAVNICLASQFPMLIWWGPDLVMLYNDAYRVILGEKHPQSLGQRGSECWPEIWDIIGPMLDGVMTHGEATWSENQLLLLKRSSIIEECYFTFSYSPIHDESGAIAGIFTAVTETTGQVLGDRRMRSLRALAASTAEARTLKAVCLVTAQTLVENPDDVPFSLLYLLSSDGKKAEIAAATRWPDAMMAPMESCELADEVDALWPFARIIQTGQPILLDKLPERLGRYGIGLPEDISLPQQALLMPFWQPGQAAPYGFLIVGINPLRSLDEDYRGFLSLLAGQVATACAAARAYQDAREQAEALAELDRAKTAFFSNVSHEFRTPLTLSLGPLEAVLSDTAHPLTEEQRAQLEMVRRNGLRQLKLVNTLLDFSRIEAGRVEALYVPTDLARLTRDLVSSFHSAIERANLTLVVECAPLPEPIYVDQEMWEKIVLNLVSNALKYTLAGSIRIALQMENDVVTLTVQDTGVGIPAEDVPHLFERFYRVRQSQGRTQEGSGIGLSLVQELVRLHGGTISVESQLGVGSTFTIQLLRGHAHLPAERLGMESTLASITMGADPYVEEALRWLSGDLTASRPVVSSFLSDSIGGAEATAFGGDTTQQKATLLVVDDNADMRDYLNRLLAPTYRVWLAVDGIEALRLTRSEQPDMIISDVMMPGLDGFALLNALRSEPATKNIPFLLLSARAGEEATLEGLQAGADDYLIKPFSARELLGRIQSRLEIARLSREAENARQRLQRLLMQAPAVIAVLNGPTHIFTLVNALYSQVLGRSAEALLGKPVREALPEVEGQGFFELLDQVYQTGEPFYGNEMCMMVDRGGNGNLEEIYFNFIYQATYDTNEKIDGVLVHAVDVTEFVHARQRVEALLVALEEADQRKDEFLHMVSHELRTPITAIKGNIQLTQRRLKRFETELQEPAPPTVDELRQMHGFLTQLMERAARQIEAQKRLINDLLDVSRIQSGKLDLTLELCDLVSMVEDSVLDQHSGSSGHQIILQIEPDQSPLIVMADEGRIGQVINNYLTNARKYSPTSAAITVGISATASEARVWVRDGGPGLNAQQQKQIWERFYQDPDIPLQTGSGQGMGLGLHICQTIVQLHNGEVGVESEPGHGSTFWFTLPLVDA